MLKGAHLAPQADSLMEILSAQCADLEALLGLARLETEAAATGDFAAVMGLVERRVPLVERLEVYHRRIAELRAKLGEGTPGLHGLPLTDRTVRLAAEIQEQDARTRPLLMRAFEETALSLSRLDRGRRGTSAYLRDGRPESVACDRHA